MDCGAAAAKWVDAWSRGWATGDADIVVARYASQARVRTLPFREPEPILDYARRNFALEEDLDFSFGRPVVGADGRAAVEYWSSWREAGEVVTIAGVSLLRFGEDGLVEEHWDYWVSTEGRLRPPAGWGQRP